jgi:hypothetical protein
MKGRKKVVAKTHPTYLGSNSGDETKITTIGLSSDDYEDRCKLFHIRVIMKHTKIDTLLDSGFQSNLISEVVKQLGLTTKLHHKPYPLKWINNNYKFPITKKCTSRFAISSKFVDEVTCDVVPLKECGMVLGSPYLYDSKEIFFKEKNKYHLLKKGTEYVVHVHHIKANQTLLRMEQLRNVSYASNISIIVPSKAVHLKHEHEMVVRCEFNHTLLQDKLMSCKTVKHIGSFLVIFMILSLLMFSTWMVVDSVRCERVKMTNKMISVVMVIMQLIVMQAVHRKIFKYKGQVGRPIPHLISG